MTQPQTGLFLSLGGLFIILAQFLYIHVSHRIGDLGVLLVGGVMVAVGVGSLAWASDAKGVRWPGESCEFCIVSLVTDA